MISPQCNQYIALKVHLYVYKHKLKYFVPVPDVETKDHHKKEKDKNTPLLNKYDDKKY